jgi:homocysteine S-methyltransferase
VNLNFFKQTRILDGGMGQELLARGMDSTGTLWSTKALIEPKYHKLIEDIHRDFVKSGAEIIVTATFTSRRIRLRENGIEDQYEKLNKTAGEIAQRVKKDYPNIFIAGGLPPQYLTYEADTRSAKEIFENYNEQASILNPYIDFFYLDVLSSVNEIEIAIKAIKKFEKPYLIGAHISEGTRLPSGEKISDIVTKIKHEKLLGLILACISPENYELNKKELKKIGVPFGFKVNGFITTKPNSGYTKSYKKSKSGNPNEFLGQRKDLTPEKIKELAKIFKEDGATILGGCCEIKPSHIKEIASLK